MTAVLPTAATQASAARCFQQPLRGSQRAYAWQRPPAAIAAWLSYEDQRRASAMGTYLPLERRAFHTARAAMRPINTLLEHAFTTLEIRLENPTARKPAWMLEPCLRL